MAQQRHAATRPPSPSRSRRAKASPPASPPPTAPAPSRSRSTPTKGADDIVTPGHVFPLRARDGGVLVRAGHTEAAVDISRLAGLNPSGVICEIMNDDGTMARLPDLVAFAQRHGLKIGTIADLIAYRRRHDSTAAPGAAVFTDQAGGGEHLVLTKGDLTRPSPVLVRMHAIDPLDDLLAIHPDARTSCATRCR
jgi:3,4-dihydroxy 2-butanone 4-phosphate synthase / GTP cyclohydrolase II